MRAWSRMSIILTWQVTASICFYAVFAATPFFREFFGVSRFLVGIAVTAAMLGYTVFLFPMGAAVDGLGERKTMIVGLIGLGIAALWIAVSPTYLVLLIGLLISGGMYASAMPATNRAILMGIPYRRRNIGLGIKQVGVTGGSGASAILITQIGETSMTWRGGFVLAAGVAFLGTIGFALIYPPSPGTGSLDFPDVRGLFSNLDYRLLSAAGFFLGATMFTTTGYTALFVHESIGTSVGFAGFALALVQVTGSAGRVLAGWIADYLSGPPLRRITQLLIVQTTGSLGLFVLITQLQTALGALLIFGALGFVVMGFAGLYFSCLGELVPDEQVGAATAGATTTVNIGALITPPLFGLVADISGYVAGWLLLAAYSVAAIVFLGVLLVTTAD